MHPHSDITAAQTPPGRGIEVVRDRDHVAQTPQMCRAAVANNDIGRIYALLPRLLAAQLQPCRAQRIQVKIVGHSGEAVDTCGHVGNGERAVIDQPLQILP